MRGLLIAALLPLASCEESAGPGPLALELQRAKWDAREPVAYSFQIRVSCFCGIPSMSTVTVQVLDGMVQSRTWTDTGDEVSEELASLYPSIDGVFDRLERVARGGPDRFEVAFHEDFGFPTQASADPNEGIADEEFSIWISDYQESLMSSARR
jgi:hypothetical protein